MRDLSGHSPTDLDRLLALVERLRAPDGCPWDREQSLGDLRAYLLEEAHETADAIDREDPDALASELGDLLFQVAFLTTLAVERGWFGAAEPLERAFTKMVDRHPHVFGDERAADAAEVRAGWERRKVRQRDASASHLDGASTPSLPALVASYRLTQKAAGVGFDWPDAAAVLGKLDEELEELRREVEDGAEGARERRREEVGDLLFTVANLARHLDVDPEAALARANLKFRRRFGAVERRLREAGRRLDEATLQELDAEWERVKRDEREAASTPPGRA